MPRFAYAAAAKRGASLLDEQFPGWFRKIDTSGLDLESPTACILGQTFKDAVDPDKFYDTGFDHGVERLALDEEDTVHYGFDAPSMSKYPDSSYAKLAHAWKRQIAQRYIKEAQRILG